VLWRRPWFFVALVAATLSADWLSLLLRQLIGRDRPPLVYPDPRPLVGVPRSGAFPTRHPATAFAPPTEIAWASRRLPWPAYVLAALVAWSRVYVGVHWPLDFIGGAVLGVLVATALLKLLEARPRSLRAPRAG
jgi:undecaprenyl-diphosphatase